MIELGKKKLCEKCFAELSETDKCDCNHPLNRNDSLEAGVILNGRYIVGRELAKSSLMRKYLAYDSVENTKVLIKEFHPELLVSREKSGVIVLKNEDNLDAYNYLMQKFIQILNLSQKADEGLCFKISEAFYTNNTAYFIVENYDAIPLAEYTKNGSEFSDKDIINAIHRLFHILNSTDYPKCIISDKTVLVSNDKSIIFDGFELTENVYLDILNDSIVSEQNLNYISRKQLTQKTFSKHEALFSIGAIAYTMLTNKAPELPFEENRFDFSTLKDNSNLEQIIKRMCSENNRDDENDLLINDLNNLFKKYNLPKIQIIKPEEKTHFRKKRLNKCNSR